MNDGLDHGFTGRARPPGGPERKPSGHAPPSWVKSGVCFFVTICCATRKVNRLCHPRVSRVIFESASRYQEASKWHLRLLLLMPDHLHALVVPNPDRQFARLIGDWKRYVASVAGVDWQKNFFDHRLRNDESWEEKAHYIRENPVRAGLIREGATWPYQIQF